MRNEVPAIISVSQHGYYSSPLSFLTRLTLVTVQDPEGQVHVSWAMVKGMECMSFSAYILLLDQGYPSCSIDRWSLELKPGEIASCGFAGFLFTTKFFQNPDSKALT